MRRAVWVGLFSIILVASGYVYAPRPTAATPTPTPAAFVVAMPELTGVTAEMAGASLKATFGQHFVLQVWGDPVLLR